MHDGNEVILTSLGGEGELFLPLSSLSLAFARIQQFLRCPVFVLSLFVGQWGKNEGIAEHSCIWTPQ